MTDWDHAQVVIIDANNVCHAHAQLRSGTRMVDLCASHAGAHGYTAFVVFDGPGPYGRPELGVGTSVRVLASGSRQADQLIERRANELVTAGSSFWVVSSDAVVRQVAGASAERVVDAATFAAALLSPDLREIVESPEGDRRATVENTLSEEQRVQLERMRRGLQ